MDFKVIWTDPAIQNLQEITAYISRDNSAAALKFGDELFHHVEVLETFPFIGPTYPRGERGPIREIIFRKYRIFIGSVKNINWWRFLPFGMARAMTAHSKNNHILFKFCL